MSKLFRNSFSLTFGLILGFCWRFDLLGDLFHWVQTFGAFLILFAVFNAVMVFGVMPRLMQNPYEMLEYSQMISKLTPLLACENQRDPLSIGYTLLPCVGFAFLRTMGLAEVGLLELVGIILISSFPFILVLKITLAWFLDQNFS